MRHSRGPLSPKHAPGVNEDEAEFDKGLLGVKVVRQDE